MQFVIDYICKISKVSLYGDSNNLIEIT